MLFLKVSMYKKNETFCHAGATTIQLSFVFLPPAVETAGAVGQQQGTVHIEEGSERIEQYEWIKGLGLTIVTDLEIQIGLGNLTRVDLPVLV